MTQIPDHFGDVGPGWQTILERLHYKLLRVDSGYEVAQVKEKFGGLRVYLDLSEGAPTNRAHRMIDAAEHVSIYTCERCGDPSTGPERGPTGWLKTLCLECGE